MRHAALLVLAALGLAGCGTEIDVDRTEQLIADDLTETIGAQVTSVACPDEPGERFTCKVTAGDDTSADVGVRVIDDNGNVALEARFLNKRELEQTVLARYAQQQGLEPMTIAMDCPEIIPVEKGGAFVCEGERLGERFKVDVTQTNGNGQIDVEEQQ